MNVNQKEAKRLIRIADVRSKVALGRSTIYGLMSKNKFPKSISLGSTRATAWLESEVDQWIGERLLARDDRGIA